MKIPKYALLLLFFVFLSACTSTTPKCSDIATINVLKDIFIDSITKDRKEPLAENVISEIKSRLTFNVIRTSQYDKNLDKYTCSAKMEVVLTKTMAEHMNNALFVLLLSQVKDNSDIETKNNKLSQSVVYTSQKTEDSGKDEFYVELSEHPMFTAIFALNINIGEFGIKKNIQPSKSSEQSSELSVESSSDKIENSNSIVNHVHLIHQEYDSENSNEWYAKVIEKNSDGKLKLNIVGQGKVANINRNITFDCNNKNYEWEDISNNDSQSSTYNVPDDIFEKISENFCKF